MDNPARSNSSHLRKNAPSSAPKQQAIGNNAARIFHDLKKEDFEVMKMLGRGTFGTVRKVRLKRNNQIYALKTIPLQKKKFTYKITEHDQM